MAKLNINIGTTANDRTGDPLRTAFEKVNSNFDELYAMTGDDLQIPALAGNTGKVLTTNGTTLSWGVSNLFNQSLNTTNSVTFNSVAASTVNVSQINGTNPGNELVIQANNHNWTFGTDGTLTLPVGSDILDSTGASVLHSGAELVGEGVTQVGSSLVIATDSGGGLTGWSSTAASIAYDANILSTYAVGSTITWQDGTTATLTQVDDYGPGSLDIFWDTPKTGTLFPITLKTANYVAATPVRSSITVTGKQWTFNENGSLTYPNTALQKDTGAINCQGNASTVVYTGSGVGIHTIRLLIQVEGFEGANDIFDTQACEMIIAKSFRADDIAASVYGIVYTSVAPLATFTALWNGLTSRIEVLCTTPGANSVNVKIFATEISTSD